MAAPDEVLEEAGAWALWHGVPWEPKGSPVHREFYARLPDDKARDMEQRLDEHAAYLEGIVYGAEAPASALRLFRAKRVDLMTKNAQKARDTIEIERKELEKLMQERWKALEEARVAQESLNAARQASAGGKQRLAQALAQTRKRLETCEKGGACAREIARERERLEAAERRVKELEKSLATATAKNAQLVEHIERSVREDVVQIDADVRVLERATTATGGPAPPPPPPPPIAPPLPPPTLMRRAVQGQPITGLAEQIEAQRGGLRAAQPLSPPAAEGDAFLDDLRRKILARRPAIEGESEAHRGRGRYRRHHHHGRNLASWINAWPFLGFYPYHHHSHGYHWW